MLSGKSTKLDRLFAAVDHVILLCADLKKTSGCLSKLGFCLTPRASHSIELGTANRTAVFPDKSTYIELLGIEKPTRKNASRRNALEALGPHIYGVAFKGDARESWEHFRALNLEGEPVYRCSRKNDASGKLESASFSVARTKSHEYPGPWIFVCEHHTPELVWSEEFLEHPNGALGISGLYGVASDIQPLVAVWSRIFGQAITYSERHVLLSTQSAFLDFRTENPFGRVSSSEKSSFDPAVVALEIRVRCIHDIQSILRSNEINYISISDKRLIVPDINDLGTSIVFRSE